MGGYTVVFLPKARAKLPFRPRCSYLCRPTPIRPCFRPYFIRTNLSTQNTQSQLLTGALCWCAPPSPVRFIAMFEPRAWMGVDQNA
eukprot:1181031-Prorocentrum_minimum.AAC.3